MGKLIIKGYTTLIWKDKRTFAECVKVNVKCEYEYPIIIYYNISNLPHLCFRLQVLFFMCICNK